MKVLFLCSANQCRSAMAEALLKRGGSAIPGLEVGSAGVGGYGNGFGVTPETAQVLVAHGVDASAHRSREATAGILGDAELVIGMTRDHVRRASALEPSIGSRAFTLSEVAAAADLAGPRVPHETAAAYVARLHATRSQVGQEAADVPDPVLEPDVITYEQAFSVISDHVETLISALAPRTAH